MGLLKYFKLTVEKCAEKEAIMGTHLQGSSLKGSIFTGISTEILISKAWRKGAHRIGDGLGVS